jgi:hypothetical protein
MSSGATENPDPPMMTGALVSALSRSTVSLNSGRKKSRLAK